MIEHPVKNGIKKIECENWEEFISFALKKKEAFQFSWRGQSDASWKLKSSLDRELDKMFGNDEPQIARENAATEHLNRFKYLCRNRISYDQAYENDDDEMWAIAQHYGLKTPLLDWTYSPFVALFFAIHNHLNENITCAVWGIGPLTTPNKRASKNGIAQLKRIHPKQKINERLSSQNGLFTRLPLGTTVENWVKDISTYCKNNIVYLYQICIPMHGDNVKNCLTMLNRMNINYYTLFPDFEGVANFGNMALRIPRYHRFW